MAFCKDCGNDRFVWDRDGDVTCRSCGLVHIERYIDDTHYGSYFQDPCEEYKEEDDNVVPKETTRHIDTIIDDTMKEEAAAIYKRYCEGKPNKKTKAAIYANCLYYASNNLNRGYDINSIITMMRITSKEFYDNFNDVGQCLNKSDICNNITNDISNTQHALIKRYVNICDIIDDDRKWDIVKLSQSIYKTIKESDYSLKMKNSKLIVTIIYISSKILNITIPLIAFAKSMNISILTLKKHEKNVKNILDVIINKTRKK